MKYFLKYAFCTLCLLFSVAAAKSQDRVNVRTLIRYQLDSIDGVYIPKDIYDAFEQIDGFWSDSLKQEIKKIPEEEFSAESHFGFGLWMRNNWGLWSGSRLSKYFNELGIFHPDDISGIILHSYHRYLLDRDIDLDGQVAFYKNYAAEAQNKQKASREERKDRKERKRGYRKDRKERLKDMKEELKPYKLGVTMYYDYPYGFPSEQEEDRYDAEECYALGTITDRAVGRRLIKVRLVKSCNPDGVIIYDTHYGKLGYKDEEYDPDGRIIPQAGRQIFYMKEGEEYWFEYDDDYWELDD